MTEKFQHPDADDGDEAFAALLRAAGRRELPPQQVTAEVRAAVHEEWQAVVRHRRRSRFAKYAIAAGIAAISTIALFQIDIARRAEPFAQIARMEGIAQVSDDGTRWRALRSGDRLARGMTLRTDATARIALAFDDGLSVRMDAYTQVQLGAADEIAMSSGALYVDASPALASQPLTIETRYGAVRHVGTQYELRDTARGIEVSVREGRVEIERASQKISAAVGEQLLLTADGARDRRPVSPQDPRWEWATSIAPTFDIEHQPLSLFLQWVARETGRNVVYSDALAQEQSGKLVLRGSIRNLPPDQALAAVMATTAMTYSSSPTEIHVRAAH